MLITLAGSLQGRTRAQLDCYAAWRAAIERLREDWQQGQRPAPLLLPDYLAEVPEKHRGGALEDLVAEHLRLAWAAGSGQPLEDYYHALAPAWPHLASPTIVPAELAEDELLARYLSPRHDAPGLAEYQRRFPGRPDVVALLQPRFLADERYVRLRRRARGAMGDVWEAYDRRLRRLVAVKQPTPDVAQHPELLQRFAEEARTTAALEHPAIVAVHEFHEHEAGGLLVMPLVDGPTLGEQIRDFHRPGSEQTSAQSRLDFNRLVHCFLTVCEAVAYAHSRGVLHRDLKPGNVVVGAFGQVVILDWGMAQRLPTDRAFSSTQQPSAAALPAPDSHGTRPLAIVVGTPEYMPPEQVQGIADARSDVFGLGAILYEMLTAGALYPWPPDARPDDWPQIVSAAHFAPPRQVCPSASRVLEAVCLKATARDPRRRYQTAAELADDVRRYLAGEPTTVRRDSLWTRAGRWLARSRA